MMHSGHSRITQAGSHDSGLYKELTSSYAFLSPVNKAASTAETRQEENDKL